MIVNASRCRKTLNVEVDERVDERSDAVHPFRLSALLKSQARHPHIPTYRETFYCYSP